VRLFSGDTWSVSKQQAKADPRTRNVEVVRATFEALSRGDLDALMTNFDPEIEVIDEANQVGARGCEQYRSWMVHYLDAWEYYREFPERLIPAGDLVVVCVRSEGRGAGSGATVVESHGEIHTLRDGLILRIRIYPTFAEAVGASGVDVSDS
jgi:ketosteroid isomerase-like protein